VLFAESELIGTFKGFNDRGLEFAAEIIAPYDAGMLERPQLGQFLLIELASAEEAALGRITRFVPSGLLATAEGEDYVNTMQRRQQAVPEDLKEQRLKYRVQVKLLGALKLLNGKVVYVPSQRRLPHLGARVAFPSSTVLKELCRLSQGSTELGDYVLGEFVYCGAKKLQENVMFRSVDPHLPVTFDVRNLVARRSVVFARAGYGKSNLMKFLVAELYRTQPETAAGRKVGTLIFDPNGEYFWPDIVVGRPGLCDVPHLKDNLVVFTNKREPNPYYGGWKIGQVKLDIRDLRPRDVISIAISPDRQDQQNVIKLKSLSENNWRLLVDLIETEKLGAPDQQVGQLLGYTTAQIQNSLAEIAAARSNMANVVRLLHDPSSRLLAGTLAALEMGKIVVIDLSLLSSTAGNVLAGLLMRRIFSHNQENFTGGQAIIPVVAVLEEAQSVLGKSLDDTSPYVEWVKEGRKYDLGAILITQQPGSMAAEILSQADNWFCFHLLSEGDAGVLGKYNSHYSDDVLSHIIGEPIPGNCYMWSAPHQPFVLPVRVRSFEEAYSPNVKKDSAAAQVTAPQAQQVQAALEGALDRLSQSLTQSLKQPNVRWVRIPQALPGGVEGVGIKTGQLYYLIKEIKTPSDTQSEEQLKRVLLDAILGEGVAVLKQHEGADYFCARQDQWETALQKSIKPV
jgi:uncharacterized protein